MTGASGSDARGDATNATVDFVLDGTAVIVAADGTLLDALREQLGVRSVKDGCSPQGQCGCCTVLVDGAPRVSCVTPVSRVSNRSVTTVDGLDDSDAWAASFTACGASQCGFCTPGIITRLSSLSPTALADRSAVDRALLAHLCRCTGWQTVREAAVHMSGRGERDAPERDLAAAARRAEIEGGLPQRVGDGVALGRGGFADDTAPADALVAVRAADGHWVVGSTRAEALASAGKVQGRRTTAPVRWPIEPPPGDWSTTLTTTWVEPAYLEPDAAWCRPGQDPVSSLGNGGAFGGKATTDAGDVARRLADHHHHPVRVLWSREDTVRFGPKRPPLAIGLRPDGTGIVRAARPTVGSGDLGARLPDGVELQWVDVVGPGVSLDLRGAVLAELLAARAVNGLAPDDDVVSVTTPAGGTASARFDAPADGVERVVIEVACGALLDEVVARSFCIGAAHMALGMVRSEALALDDAGEPLDLTIRSFGVLRAGDTPQIDVRFRSVEGAPINASDAVFAAVLGAAWHRAGTPDRWPV